jgi:hypothetical protein
MLTEPVPFVVMVTVILTNVTLPMTKYRPVALAVVIVPVVAATLGV